MTDSVTPKCAPLHHIESRSEHSVRHSRRFSDELIEDARKLFQRRTARILTAEDARQILENLTGFFTVLHDMDRERSNREAAQDEADAKLGGQS